MKRIVSILMIAILCFMMTGCQNPISTIRQRWRPSQQPGTTWESEDGTISFVVIAGNDKTERGYKGQMNIDGETIEFWGIDAEVTKIVFRSPREAEEQVVYASLSCVFRKNKFTATVVEILGLNKREYFEVGTKFVFTKTEE